MTIHKKVCEHDFGPTGICLICHAFEREPNSSQATIALTVEDYNALMMRKVRTVRYIPSAVLALMEQYGIPREDICEAAGITRNNFRQHLHLARKAGGAA